MDERGQALTDQLVGGASDYIITKDILERGGDWNEEAITATRWVTLGTLAYLVNLSQRGGFEDELNVMLNRLADQMDGG